MNPALLPLLPAVPLLASGATVVLRSLVLDRVLLVGVPLASTVLAILLLIEHTTTPVLAHGVGGFVPGVAIPFVSDTLTAVMIAVTSLVTTVVAVFLILTGEDRYRFLPPLTLMLLAGVNGALVTGDLFNLFVFVEVMLLPSYALIAVTGSWRRLGIGRLFILVNLVTSTILLIGVGWVYAAAGTVNLAALAGVAHANPQVGLAIVVVLLALAIKAGVVPTHGWLPRAYPATSAGVMALFSGLHTKVALYAIYRIYATTYGGQAAPWLPVLLILVMLTVLVGAISTGGQRRIRAFLAFQMISGVGYILFGVVLLTPAALAAGLFYLLHHVVTMGALVLAAGAIEHTYGSGQLSRLHGLMRRDRVIAVVTALGLMSLVGLPPTSGLWGKLGLVRAAAGAGDGTSWLLIAALVIGSLISLLALQHLWIEVFFGPPMEEYRPDNATTGRGELVPIPDSVRVRPALAAPAVVLTVVMVGMFLAAGWLMPIAHRAAHGLLELQPYVEAVLR